MVLEGLHHDPSHGVTVPMGDDNGIVDGQGHNPLSPRRQQHVDYDLAFGEHQVQPGARNEPICNGGVEVQESPDGFAHPKVGGEQASGTLWEPAQFRTYVGQSTEQPFPAVTEKLVPRYGVAI